jgi:hypothetical protein
MFTNEERVERFTMVCPLVHVKRKKKSVRVSQVQNEEGNGR